ncbi:allophanate hydrolase [Anoxybacter fermentans]|uniref:Allophanate hydrolase n=1 Tax=Anoxybacter fermentans TaxID=1323375 RepID=A0A3Q9HNS6_9FIRM|nr:5-oxoprolinase subunit PxpB [Anoxybacter fermentans]AZR72087.1 allophanate hydrolase [Anoxybacter fermentans]
MKIDFKPLGDRGIRIGFPQVISPEVNRMIRAIVFMLTKEQIHGILELVPTYAAISVYYEPKLIRYGDMKRKLEEIIEGLDQVKLPPARLVEIPVLYGGEKGPDLDYVAEYHGLTVDEVVKLHTSRPYLVYMIGFTPGFPYLGGLPEKLATPRLNNPRPKIPAGSVGIGGSQTGIYSIDAPGGWRIIGHTPVRLYDPDKEEPVLLKAGDYLQFKAVDKEEYLRIKEMISREKYQLRIRKWEEEEKK